MSAGSGPSSIGDTPKRFGIVIACIIIALITLRQCNPGAETSSTSQQAIAPVAGSQASAPSQRQGIQQRTEGTSCPSFVEGGVTCDIGPGATDWVRPDSDAKASLYICWEGSPELFDEVSYLTSSGIKKTYDYANPPDASEHVKGYKFDPKTSMTLSYGLQTTPCRTQSE